MPRKLNRHVKRFAIRSLFRPAFTYEVRVCKKSGRILGYRAGCRRWPSYRHAEAHYNGYGENKTWCQARFDKGELTRLADGLFGSFHHRLREYSERREAREILKKLRVKATRFQAKVRA